jgi:hypothetical protein
MFGSICFDSSVSRFTVRCEEASLCESETRRSYGNTHPELLTLSCCGPDSSIKAIRAQLFDPRLTSAISLCESPDVLYTKDIGLFSGGYETAVARLDRGAVHLVARARREGLMVSLTPESLWRYLTGPTFTTPLLRHWMPWLLEYLEENGCRTHVRGLNARAVLISVSPEELDELVSEAMREKKLQLK